MDRRDLLRLEVRARSSVLGLNIVHEPVEKTRHAKGICETIKRVKIVGRQLLGQASRVKKLDKNCHVFDAEGRAYQPNGAVVCIDGGVLAN
jgi:hypothetical protein